MPGSQPITAAVWRLLSPDRPRPSAEAFPSPPPVPREPGFYGYNFRALLHRVAADGCRKTDDCTLLCESITLETLAWNGARASTQRLFGRMRYQYREKAKVSSPRLTLGCLLAEPAGSLFALLEGADL